MFKIIVLVLVLLNASCGFKIPEFQSYEDKQAEEAAEEIENSEGSASTPTINSDEEESDAIDVIEIDSTEETVDPEPKTRPEYLVINEVLYDIPGSDTEGDLFIELFGDSGAEIDGYQITFVNGGDGKVYKTILLPEGAIVADDGIYLIADIDSANTTKVADADLYENFDPQNGPDSFQLLDETGALIDAVGYGTLQIEIDEFGKMLYETLPGPDPSSGASISRIEGIDTDDNSEDFITNIAPSPGFLEVTVEESD